MTRKELLAIVYGLSQHKQFLLGRHIVIRTDHAALTWLRKTAEVMPQLARWLTFIEQFDYEVVHRPGIRHGNADGLSRGPPREEALPPEDEDKVFDEVRAIKKPSSTSSSAGESLHILQRRDIELGPIINLRLYNEERPDQEVINRESELTKKIATKWQRLVVVDGLVYLRDKAAKKGERPPLHLMLPRAEVENSLRLCHAGRVGGHFGFRKTIDQVRRRFYWNDWKEDTKRFCRQCDECAKYHRGKLKK